MNELSLEQGTNLTYSLITFYLSWKTGILQISHMGPSRGNLPRIISIETFSSDMSGSLASGFRWQIETVGWPRKEPYKTFAIEHLIKGNPPELSDATNISQCVHLRWILANGLARIDTFVCFKACSNERTTGFTSPRLLLFTSSSLLVHATLSRTAVYGSSCPKR